MVGLEGPRNFGVQFEAAYFRTELLRIDVLYSWKLKMEIKDEMFHHDLLN